jgi:DNA-binding NarL/FixJ family response regulator
MATSRLATRQSAPAVVLPTRRPVLAPPSGGGRRRKRRRAYAGAGAHSTPTPRHVLIVEDEALVALSLEAMVQDIGHVVVGIAANSRDAVALAVNAAPQVVLMDVRLGPAGDEGIATAATIGARTGSAILFVTAYADPTMIERVRAALPDARVLAKPVHAVELADAIEEALRGS